MHREVLVTPADLIWPLFVTEGQGVEDPIASLPGVSRWSVDGIVARAKEAVALGYEQIRDNPVRDAKRGIVKPPFINYVCRTVLPEWFRNV